MLLNGFLKEHCIVEEQGRIIALQQKDFQSAIAQQQTEIRALAPRLQKVNNKIELTKTAAQVVSNH